MKAFFSKVWAWIIKNKIVSIIIAAVFTAGVTCSIVLPIALHKHSFADEWSTDAEKHWHAASCRHDEETSDVGAHAYDNACDTKCNVCDYERTVGAHVYSNDCDTACDVCGATRSITHAYAEKLTAGQNTHYYLCTVCGDKKDEASHTYDQSVVHSDYLKQAATTNAKGLYYKSCVCGASSGNEYFEADKLETTIKDVEDLSKVYDGVEVNNPKYKTKSNGFALFEWYQGETKLSSKPVDAGTYKVKIIIAESSTYASASVEKEFTIAKKTLNYLELTKVYNGKRGFGENAGVYCQLGVEHGVVAGDTVFLETSDDLEYNVGKYYFVRMNSTDDRDTVWLHGDDAANYDFQGNDVVGEVTVTKKVLSNLTVGLTYNGMNYFEVPLDTTHGIVASDAADGIKVCITFANKNVGAAVTGAGLDAEDGNNYTNYELDLTTCTASIVKKVLSNLTVDLPYAGTNYFEVPLGAANGIVAGDVADGIKVCISFANKNVGAAVTGAGLDADDGDNYTNYELDLTTCTASIVPKVITNISVGDATYKGSTNFAFVLSALHGLVSGETFMLEVTAASKNVGNAVEITSVSYANNNYSIDKSAIILNIVPKTINVTAEFEYSGINVRQIHAPAPSLSDVIDGDEVYIEIAFDKAGVDATVLTGEDAPYLDGADCDNYTLGTYSFSIVPKKLNVPTLSKDYNGNNAVNYAFTATDGLVSGDNCTLTFNVTATDIGYYEDAAMTNIALTNPNYKIEVSTCNLHILDANDLVMLLTNKYNLEDDFILVVEIEQGTVRVGDSIVLPGTSDKVYEVLVIEKFNKSFEFATVGEEVGLYVSGMADLAEIPGASFLYELDNVPEMATEFLADVYMIPTAEGGRQTPVFNNYKPNLVGLGASQQINITLIDVYESDNDAMLSPGGTAFVKITLANPLPACLLETATFKLYEDTKYVGDAENIDLVVYDSFATALVVDCDTAYSETMQVRAGQKVYIKINGASGTLSDFNFKATDGSGATFTYEEYNVTDTTTPTRSETTATNTYYMDINGTDDRYVVITCVTAGEISITSAE